MVGKALLWFVILYIMKVLDTLALENKEFDEKPMKDRLGKLDISLDLKRKILSGDTNVFKTMDAMEFQKFTPDIIADVGAKAIENLNIVQVKTMAKNLYKGNEEHLEKIFGALNKEQLSGIIDSFEDINNNTSERKHLNCVQFEPMIKALKRTSGEPGQWSKTVFERLGSDFVQCLSPRDLKNVAGNKDAFRSVLKNVKSNEEKHRRMFMVERKSLLQEATTAFGSMKDWQLEDLRSASSLVTMLPSKDLKELTTEVVKEAIDDLGREYWEEKRGKEIVAKLKDPTKGFGEINSWTADVVDRLGNLRGSLSKKELSQISAKTLRESVRAFGETVLPPYKARALSKRLKVLYGKPKNWTKDHIRNASNLLGGMEINELEEMDEDALVEALPSVKDIKLPPHKGRVLAKKIQKKIGNVQNWDPTVVKKIGPLVKDLPETMLKLLKPDEAREAVKMLRERMDVPMSKKRVLIRQALKQGGNTTRLSVKEFGEFVTEFPLTELKKIQNVDDLLPDDSASNDSTDTEAMWNPSQARTLVEDLVTSEKNWGPVSRTNYNWSIANIKKLGRLSLGLRKSDLENLSSASFPDFAAEFSRISNWTTGQAKKISSRFMKSFEDRESEITVTEITSLGDHLINVPDSLLKKLSNEVGREAVRLMGASRLYQRLPKVLKQKKTGTALELLDKDVPSLTGAELEDLSDLVNGFTAEDIQKIDPSAFTDAVAALGDLDDLDKENVEALAAKAIEAYGGASAFGGGILHDLGKIVEGLRPEDISAISDAIIDENLHVFAEASLEADVAKVVMEKSEASRRKRRAVAMSSKTGAELIEMGSSLLALTQDQILAVTNDAFSSAVAEISKIKGFTSEQLQAWASKAKSAWGSPSTFTEDQLLQLNDFAKGFTGEELKQMTLNSNEVIASFGSVTGYSQDQVAQLWEKIKTGKSLDSFIGDDLKSLGQIALGLTSAEIGQISTDTYQNAALELGQVEGWSTEQMKGLKNKAVETFGAVSSWSSAQISLAGAAIGGFSAEEIRSINSDQLDAVKPSALKQIPPSIFKEFSVAQLSELSAEQAGFITGEQRALLSSEQTKILLEVQTDTLGYTSGCYPTKWSWNAVVPVCIILILVDFS